MSCYGVQASLASEHPVIVNRVTWSPDGLLVGMYSFLFHRLLTEIRKNMLYKMSNIFQFL